MTYLAALAFIVVVAILITLIYAAAFWVAIAAYVILDWGTNWLGMLSLLLLGLAVVGV
jgi:hypothetical protein